MKQVLGNPEKNQRSNYKQTDFNTLVIITSLMVTTYLTANVMAVKLISIFGIALFDAGTVTFPIAYMLGDVLAEIWGFKTAKKVILLTFVCNIVMVISTSVGLILPSPDYMFDITQSYAKIFTVVPRILVASLIAFLVGEILNAWVMDKMKYINNGKNLWLRTITSSALGYIFDTVIFVFIAFYGTAPLKDLFTMIFAQYIVKLAIEALCGTPLAYAVIGYIKKKGEL